MGICSSSEQSPVDIALDQLIAKCSIVVLSKTNSRKCKQAKQILSAHGAQYMVFEMDQRADGAAVLNSARRRTTKTASVPFIYVDLICIGGIRELKSLAINNELRPLLARLQP